ncbi:MAG TPA: hypothetical protein VGN80_04255 [Devosiaceae bacterium]|jgi:hypothetical protein|nr:hypothetical protein [Devosiaceae bacterium]
MPDTSINVLSPSAEKLLAGSFAAAPGDAEVVQLAERFIADELAKELKLVRFYNMPKPWSAADRCEFETYSASATGYHERMAAITQVQVTTPAGLLAQAQVLLWHSRHPSGDEVHLWNLANGVFRVLGEPLPAWVVELAEEPEE